MRSCAITGPGRRRALPDRHGRALGATSSRRRSEQAWSRATWSTPWAVIWRAAFDQFEISYDRFIRTTDADHARASTEMVRRAMAAGDIYKGTYAGWYCPGDNEFKTEAQLVDGHCPDHPTLELQWLEEENWFFAPVATTRSALEQLYAREPVLLRAGALPQRGAGLAARGPARLLDQPRRHELGHPVPGRSRAPDLRLVRRADQLHHRRRLPRRSGRVRALVAGRRARHRQEHHPLPLPVLAGDADERRPAAAAPGLRPRLHARLRARRCRKTRGNVLDPDEAVRLFGVDGVRYLVLREVPFDRDARRHATTASSGATTPTWPTTSATCSTARSA